MSELLKIDHLSVSIETAYGKVEAVRDVSLSVNPGETLAIVGESGCGKSMLCKSVMKLYPKQAKIESGSIRIKDVDTTNYSQKDMDRLRGKCLSMIFQNPMTALDPTMTVGSQIAQAVHVQSRKMSKKDVYRRVLELMDLVKIKDPQIYYKFYPHNLSGGMRQKCALAIALAGNPDILFADEPTTSLDMVSQSEILDLFHELQRKLQMAIVFVTHNLGAVAHVADRVAVMYAGKIVEIGMVEEIFYDPRHPYTQGLIYSFFDLYAKGKRLYSIPGTPPSLINPPKGDAFARRNENALAIDYLKEPPMFQITKTHYAATWTLDLRASGIENHIEGGRH